MPIFLQLKNSLSGTVFCRSIQPTLLPGTLELLNKTSFSRYVQLGECPGGFIVTEERPKQLFKGPWWKLEHLREGTEHSHPSEGCFRREIPFEISVHRS